MAGLELTLPTGARPRSLRGTSSSIGPSSNPSKPCSARLPARDGRLVTEVVEAGEERSPPIELAPGEVQGVRAADHEDAGP